MLDELKVYTKRETQKLIGLSGRTWDRLDAVGETPPKDAPFPQPHRISRQRYRRVARRAAGGGVVTSATPMSAARLLRNCPLRSGPASGAPAPSTSALREELKHLQARYDYHFPPAIFVIVRALEIEIAWREQR
jgi:hypothetical protein